MLQSIAVALVLSAAAAAPPAHEQPTAARKLEQARVVWVHDGDTITVSLAGVTEHVRLIGIDTPEVDDDRPEYRAAAYAARDHARARVQGKTITLESDPYQHDRDRYGRLLRYVVLGDGSSLNEELVRQGYARVYDRFRFVSKPTYKASELEAQREGRGVWTLPPGKWRSSSTF